jgi:hypothetical protein
MSPHNIAGETRAQDYSTIIPRYATRVNAAQCCVYVGSKRLESCSACLGLRNTPPSLHGGVFQPVIAWGRLRPFYDGLDAELGVAVIAVAGLANEERLICLVAANLTTDDEVRVGGIGQGEGRFAPTLRLPEP